MTETTPDYITNEDHGDAQPEAPGVVARVDAAYWQAQAETAIRALEQAQDTGARVAAELTAALAQCAAVTRQLDEAEAHNIDLLADASRFLAERDAALAQLASVKRQLAVTGDTLYAERRAAVAQQRRSHLD